MKEIRNRNTRCILATLFIALIPSTALVAESEIIKLDGIASFYGDEFQGRTTSSGEIFDMNNFTAAHKTLPFGTILEVTNLENGRKTIVRVNDRGPFVEARDLDVSKVAANELGMVSTGTARVSIRCLTGSDVQLYRKNLSDTGAQGTMMGVDASTAPKTTPAVPETVGTTTAPPTGLAQPKEPSPAAQNSASVLTPATVVKNDTHETAPGATSGFWRIQLGAFSQDENATRLVVKLRKDGFNPSFEKTGSLTRVVIAGIANSELPGLQKKLGSAGYANFVVRQETR